jgi:hypothetical protein
MDSIGIERNRRHSDQALRSKENENFHQVMSKKSRSSYETTSLITISPYKYKVRASPIKYH